MPARAALLIAAALAACGVIAVTALAPAPASGPPPVDRGYPPPGVTAVGTGRAAILPRGMRNERRIRRVVAAAGRRAMPRAMASARRRAERMASAAGFALGDVWAVEQDPNVPYYGSGLEQGTFGGNRFCGRVRSRRAGRRWVRTCRVPTESVVYLTVTYARR